LSVREAPEYISVCVAYTGHQYSHTGWPKPQNKKGGQRLKQMIFFLAARIGDGLGLGVMGLQTVAVVYGER